MTQNASKPITDSHELQEDLNILDRWSISSNFIVLSHQKSFYVLQTSPNNILLY